MTAAPPAAQEAYCVNTRQVAWTDMDGCPDALQIVGTKLNAFFNAGLRV